MISILRSRVVIEAKPHLSFLLGNFSRRHRASSTRSTPDVGPACDVGPAWRFNASVFRSL